MFYKRIDLKKLYEAYDSSTMEDNMPVDFTSQQNQAASDEASMPTEDAAQAEPAKSERVEVSKGNTYALPLGKAEVDELTNLASQGAGVEWKGTSPLKTVAGGREGEAATLTLGQSQKPVYLTVKLVANKDEQKGLSLNLEADDRYYVAWITTPAALLDNLDTATDLSNSVKVSVKTPVIDKGGKNVEHSLEVWKDEDAVSSEPTTDSNTESSEEGEEMIQTDYNMPADELAMSSPTISDVNVDPNLAMEAPGTAAGFDAAVESKAVQSFEDYLRKSK